MKSKKIQKIIVSEKYQNAVFMIINVFTDEHVKSKLAKFFMNDENFDVIYPLYKQYIKNQLTDAGIIFLSLKLYETLNDYE